MSNRYLPSAFVTRDQTTDKTINDMIDGDSGVAKSLISQTVLKEAKKCASCNKDITDPTHINVKEVNKTFHIACFKCSTCNLKISSAKFAFNQQSNLLCSECAMKTPLVDSERCEKCKKPVTQGVKVQGKTYHKDCYVCIVCNRQFTSGRVLIQSDGPLHDECKDKRTTKTPTSPSTTSSPTTSSDQVKLDLVKLRQLHKMGLVTDEELKQAEENSK